MRFNYKPFKDAAESVLKTMADGNGMAFKPFLSGELPENYIFCSGVASKNKAGTDVMVFFMYAKALIKEADDDNAPVIEDTENLLPVFKEKLSGEIERRGLKVDNLNVDLAYGYAL